MSSSTTPAGAWRGEVKPRIIWAFLKKDARAFFRDRFFVVVTFVGLAFYIGIFQVIPDTVDEVVDLGVSGDLGMDLESLDEDGGLGLTRYDSEEALIAAVDEGEEVMAGLAFPDGFVASVASGEEVTVKVVTGVGLPSELRGALTSAVREIAFAVAGEELPVTQLAEEDIVLGVDRAGDQVSMQERMRPLFAFLVLMVEAIALGALVADELQQRTVQAVLVTPARIRDFLTSKVVFGTALAFGESAIILFALRAFGDEPLLIALAALLGAVLVTGFALIAGSLGRDFISVLFWSMLFMIPLIIPAGALMFPGQAAGWIQAMPSYPLADVIFQVTSFGAGWGDVVGSFVALAGWCVLALAVGWWALRRRVVTL